MDIYKVLCKGTSYIDNIEYYSKHRQTIFTVIIKDNRQYIVQINGAAIPARLIIRIHADEVKYIKQTSQGCIVYGIPNVATCISGVFTRYSAIPIDNRTNLHTYQVPSINEAKHVYVSNIPSLNQVSNPVYPNITEKKEDTHTEESKVTWPAKTSINNSNAKPSSQLPCEPADKCNSDDPMLSHVNHVCTSLKYIHDAFYEMDKVNNDINRHIASCEHAKTQVLAKINKLGDILNNHIVTTSKYMHAHRLLCSHINSIDVSSYMHVSDNVHNTANFLCEAVSILKTLYSKHASEMYDIINKDKVKKQQLARHIHQLNNTCTPSDE